MASTDYDTLRHRLIALGPEVLADVLIAQSKRSDAAASELELLLAPSWERMRIFREGLARVRDPRHYRRVKETEAFMGELATLLDHLDAGTRDPREGIRAILDFHSADEDILEQTDEWYGSVSSIYETHVAPIFDRWARACDDPDWLLAQLLDLASSGEPSFRTPIFRLAPSWLPPQHLQALHAALQAHGRSYKDLLATFPVPLPPSLAGSIGVPKAGFDHR